VAEWGGSPRGLNADVAARHRAPVRIVVAVVLVLAAVSVLSYPTVGSASPSAVPVLRTWIPTPDGADGYRIAAGSDAISVRAGPGNVGGNLRAILWPERAPLVGDATECVTWSRASSDSVQEGVALRIAPRPDGAYSAVTVTKNVYLGLEWSFNVHVWAGSGLGRQIGAFELESAFRERVDAQAVRPLPWRMCARTRGLRLEVLVWPLAGPTPRWGDPRYGGSLELPDTVAPRGLTGWFVGHLGPGMSVDYTDLHGALPQEADTARTALGSGVGGVALTR
jgi:hypothetical protein